MDDVVVRIRTAHEGKPIDYDSIAKEFAAHELEYTI